MRTSRIRNNAFRRAGTKVAQTILFKSPRCEAPAEEVEGEAMNASAFVQRRTQVEARPRVTRRHAVEQAQVACAAVGLFGGVASAMFGAVFTGASWLVANEGARHWLSTTGAILLFLTIPLLIIGGFCMDWLEKDKTQGGAKGARYEDDDEEQ